MCIENQSSLSLLSAVSIRSILVVRVGRRIDGVLRANRETAVIRESINVPCREAPRVSKIGALIRILGTVEISKEVELLSRVVLVDIDSHSCLLIGRVFDTPDAARTWMLSETNFVAQPPTQSEALSGIVVGSSPVIQIESSHLRVSGAHACSFKIDVGEASSCDDQHARHGSRQKQSPS